MYPRPEQRLISIDIANAAQKLLIEQQCFQFCFPAAKTARELIECNRERLRAKFLHAPRQAFAQFEPPELPAVVVEQYAAIQRKNGVRVFAGSSVHEQF